MVNRFYDRQGKPLSTLEWAEVFEKTEDRIIGQKKLWFGRIEVSTVYLGIDHDFGYYPATRPNPHPIIFETLVFVRGRGDGPMVRYSTEDEARRGHKRMIRMFLNPITVVKTLWEARRHD